MTHTRWHLRILAGIAASILVLTVNTFTTDTAACAPGIHQGCKS